MILEVISNPTLVGEKSVKYIVLDFSVEDSFEMTIQDFW